MRRDAGQPENQPAVSRITVPLGGLSDASCAVDIEQGLARLPGIFQVRVNYPAERAMIAYDPRAVTPERIAEAILELGYEAAVPPLAHVDATEIPRPREDSRDPQERFLLNKLLFASFLSVPTCLLSWVPKLRFEGHDLVMFILATPVVFIAGSGFFKKAWGAFRRNYANLDLLIALGALTAWLYSVIDTFSPVGTGAPFYDTAAVVVTLVLLGRYLESRIKVRTGRALQALLGLADATARRVSADGTEAEVPVARLQHGDRLRIRPGERVPADGIVLEGVSSLDESALSGQPGPVDKMPGARVMAGSVNQRGSFEMEVTHTGPDTALSQIVRMVMAAQDSRIALQDHADRLAEIFVPVVVILAALTFFFWYAVGRPGEFPTAVMTAMSVLVIACPGAIGLAGPTAIMAGTQRAAGLGILFKGALALERAAAVRTVVLCRTGALMAGHRAVDSILPCEGWEAPEVLRLAGALARGSDHPAARAALEAAGNLRLPDVMGFRSYAGLGVSGIIEGQRVVVGSRRLLAAHGIDTSTLDAAVQPLEARGRSIVFVARAGALAGALSIADEVKPSAIAAVRHLKAMGMQVLVLSGDARRTVLALAEHIGADGAISEIAPDHRVSFIRRLSEGGKRVAVVGDGLADAEVLEAADVGIAVGSGADLTIKASDLTLVSSDLKGVSTALRLARRILDTVRQNLFWAFFYNSLGIPVAAGIAYPLLGWTLSPMVAAGLMGLSSLAVVANSWRLKGVKLDAHQAVSR